MRRRVLPMVVAIVVFGVAARGAASVHGVAAGPRRELASGAVVDGGALTMGGVTLSLRRIARGDEAWSAAGRSIAAAEGARLDRGRGVTEWWRNVSGGVEHGFDVAVRPAGTGELVFQLDVRGATPRLSERGIELLDPGTRRVRATYEGLLVVDADRHVVPARFEVDEGIRLVVDDRHARYPIVVDPVFSLTPDASFVGSSAEDALGAAVALSADGTRLIAGAPGRAAAVVFVDDGSAWSEDGVLAPPGAVRTDQVGLAVALSGDGTRAVVGTPVHSPFGLPRPGSGPGRADVFRREASGWVWESTLVPVTTSDASCGMAVALDQRGERLAVSCLRSGGVFVYARSGTSWVQEGSGSVLSGTRCVDLSGDGTRLLADGVILARAGSVWTVEATLAMGLLGVDSCQLDPAGSTAVVGGWWNELGVPPAALMNRAAAVSRRTGTTWSATDFLDPDDMGLTMGTGDVVVNDDGQFVVMDVPGRTVLHGFLDRGAGWTEGTSAVVLPSVGSTGLAFAGDTLAVGSRDDDTSATNAGSVHVFRVRVASAGGEPCADASDCISDFCADGVCCDTDCGGPGDCQACSVAAGAAVDGTCAVITDARICRPAGAACDEPERCAGAASCPADLLAVAGAECRAPAGPCDATERCDGASPECPVDAFLTGIECRASAGACDLPEVCLGDIAECPADVVASSGTVCRASVDALCDPAESCDGTSATCAADTNRCGSDATLPDAGPPGPDAGGPPAPTRGCGCRASATSSGLAPFALLSILAVAAGRRRR